MSGLNMRFYRGRGSGKAEVERHPAVDLFWKVNPFWTAERLARMDEMSMGVWGETFWAIERHRGVGLSRHAHRSRVRKPRSLWWPILERLVGRFEPAERCFEQRICPFRRNLP